MNEQELNKKLAEWAGFRLLYRDLEDGRSWYWVQPSGQTQSIQELLPAFPYSIDACFKWLVPEALRVIAEKGCCPPIMKLFQLWYDELVSLTGDSGNIQKAALALCLAIEKLIDGGT